MSANSGAAVDFSAFLQIDTIDHEVLGPDGVTGTGWHMTISSAGHEKAVAYQTAQAKKNLRKQRQVEAAQVNGRKYVPDEKSPDDARRENMEWIASRIIDWSPVKLPHITGNDEPVAFSDEMAVRVLMHPSMGFVFSQLVDVVTDDKRFTKRSETTSERGPSTTSA